MDRIYFDQAATSFPKGKGVVNAMTEIAAIILNVVIPKEEVKK